MRECMLDRPADSGAVLNFFDEQGDGLFFAARQAGGCNNNCFRKIEKLFSYISEEMEFNPTDEARDPARIVPAFRNFRRSIGSHGSVIEEHTACALAARGRTPSAATGS